MTTRDAGIIMIMPHLWVFLCNQSEVIKLRLWLLSVPAPSCDQEPEEDDGTSAGSEEPAEVQMT